MRQRVKMIVFFLFWVAVLPLSISFLLMRLIFNTDDLVKSYTQFLSLIPGQTGNYFRKAALRTIIRQCDVDCQISFGVIFSFYDTDVHSGVYIGPACDVGMCSIGKNCLLGSGVHVMSGKKQHVFSDLDTPIRDQGGSFTKVSIGEDTWIGNGAMIMANIGKKCIVGAGSVVADDVPDYSIVAGNPARIIKKRADL